MGEENKKTNNQVVTTVKESKTNHEKSNKVFYGDGKQVLPVGVLDYNDFSVQTKREQKMEGFDPQYRDFVDYILKYTGIQYIMLLKAACYIYSFTFR